MGRRPKYYTLLNYIPVYIHVIYSSFRTVTRIHNSMKHFQAHRLTINESNVERTATKAPFTTKLVHFTVLLTKKIQPAGGGSLI